MVADEYTAKIRKAVIDDCNDITSIAQQAYSIYLDRMQTKPFPMLDDYSIHITNGNAFVLEDEKGVRGYIVLIPKTPDTLMLDTIAVTPQAQKTGYGRRLALFAEEYGRSNGYTFISLYTNEVMTENYVWYERLGYAETHRATEGEYRRIYMKKSL